MDDKMESAKFKPHRPSSLEFGTVRRQFSEDNIINKQKVKSGSTLKRAQTERVRSTRRVKVLCKAKSKAFIKVTLSPEKSPKDDDTDFELAVNGVKEFSSSFKNSQRYYKFYMDTTDNLDQPINADLIVKKNKQVVHRIPLGDIKQKQELMYKEIGVTVCPEVKMPELRTYNTEGFLCNEEKSFLEKRKLFVQTAVQKLIGEEIMKTEIPNIAIMGSGGGYRAMTAMSGVINALHDTKIIDTILYAAALSGSSWYLAVLYSHPHWPYINPRTVQQRLRELVTEKKHSMAMIFTQTCFDFLMNRKPRWSFTSNIFGPLLGDSLIPDRRDCRWSQQASKVTEGTAPLPLLAAINAMPEKSITEFHEWVEFSPFEVNLSKNGAAIKMKHFGSRFQKGIVEHLEQEIPLSEIMGICGSAFTITFEELQEKAARKKKNAVKQVYRSVNTVQNFKAHETDDLEVDCPTSICTKNDFDVLDGPIKNFNERKTTDLENDSPKNKSTSTVNGVLEGPTPDVIVDSYDDNDSFSTAAVVDSFGVVYDACGHFTGCSCHQGDAPFKDVKPAGKNPQDSTNINKCRERSSNNKLNRGVRFDYSDHSPEDVIDTTFENLPVDVIATTLGTDIDVQQVTTNDDVEKETFDSMEDDDWEFKTQSFDESNEPSVADLENLFETLCNIQKDKEEHKNIVGAEGDDEIDGVFDVFSVERIKRCWLKNRSLRAAEINNFLRKVSFEDYFGSPPKNESLFDQFKSDMDTLLFIDAGLVMNSPYPLLFQPGRDIDLILSFEFTDRHRDSESPFKMILKAEQWAKKNHIKFPKITVDENKKVEELYIFDDDKDLDCPTVMHFVLVNKDFWKYRKPGVERSQAEKDRLKKFKVFDDGVYDCKVFNYTEEKFDTLADLAEFIVLNNEQKIKDCIQKTIEKKRKQRRRRHKSDPK